MSFASCSIRKHVPEGEMILKNNVVEIHSKDVDFTKSDISDYIIQSSNPKFLGVMPLTWVYYKTEKKKDKKFFNWINKTIGEKPVYFNILFYQYPTILSTNPGKTSAKEQPYRFFDGRKGHPRWERPLVLYLPGPAVSAPSPVRPRRAAASWRILYLRILPAAFMGKLSTNSMYRGTLCRAMLALM